MEIIEADTIEQYNRFFGFQTRHPLVCTFRPFGKPADA